MFPDTVLQTRKGHSESGKQGTMLGYSLEAQQWLHGAIDMHVHGYPEISRKFVSRESDVVTARLASSYGVTGWVLKSHLWPTTDRAHYLCEALRDIDFTIFPSIALNPILGGISPFVVEAAAAHGAKVVFMPTWGSDADVKPDSYILDLLSEYMPRARDYATRTAARALDGDGLLTRETIDVIDLCREMSLVLCTGHLSLQESMRIADYAGETGFKKLVVTHPLSYVSAPEELIPFAERGAVIEFATAGHFNPRNTRTIRDVHAALNVVGPERCILTTDVFSPFAPPQPECLRIAVQQLAFLGWSRSEVDIMIRQNPRRLLDLDEVPSEAGVPTRTSACRPLTSTEENKHAHGE